MNRILGIGLISLAALSAGGGNLTAQNISLKAVNRPATEVFSAIMEQSGKNFIYSSDLLKGIRVSVDLKKQPLDKALHQIFDNTGVRFIIHGDDILLIADKKERQTPVARESAPKVTVSGFVRESGNEEAVIGAYVRATRANDSTIVASATTNVHGFFTMSVPEGSATLMCSYPGSRLWEKEMTLKHDTNLAIRLESATQLEEVVIVGSKNRVLTMVSPLTGALNITGKAISATPTIFGESDIIKTLQLEPGVSPGVEGMAGMYVHGGNSDENLYMLDNIPLYQVNHFGGLFSAFNTDAIRNVDFYKSAVPSKYDGRLSSFVDVNTRDGARDHFGGSFKLGLTSGALSLEGPIGKRTSYSLALRRSWYDVLTVPALAIINSISNNGEKTIFRYAFTDLNAKITHEFSRRSALSIGAYYGNDYLKGGNESVYHSSMSDNSETREKDVTEMSWGNTVVNARWKYVFSPRLFGTLTGAYSRYSSEMTKRQDYEYDYDDGIAKESDFKYSRDESDNKIDDIIAKADFEFKPDNSYILSFGASYIRHSYLPSRSKHTLINPEAEIVVSDNARHTGANEVGAYVGNDWHPSDHWRLNGGVNTSLFNIYGKTHFNLSPRLALMWSPRADRTFKASYARTVQYVHQLSESSISLPTDQWIPISANGKPQTSDKVSVAANFTRRFGSADYTLSVEGYMKWMRNLIEYRDEYYIIPPSWGHEARLVSGKGQSKGIDIKIAKETGRITGHISYSLLWADRTFEGKNRGLTYPARFDNRHKINISANWKINDRWSVGASWTGMSGNRITLPTQCWVDPDLDGYSPIDPTLVTEVNNYRLPFYHRLDLGFTRYTKHGYWTFSLYNAYCHMNVIGVRLGEEWKDNSYGDWVYYPKFQKVKLLPIIPSVSYTWIF